MPKKQKEKQDSDAYFEEKIKERNEEAEDRGVKPIELLSISKWAFQLLYGIAPFYTITYFASYIIREFQTLINTLIFAKTIDKIIGMTQTGDASVEQLYPYIAILFAYNFFNFLVNLMHTYSLTALRITQRPRIRQAFYTKLNNLGIQTIEQPNISDKIHRAERYLGNVVWYLQDLAGFVANSVQLVTSLVLVYVFMPIFIPILLVLYIPYYLLDKKYRRRVYKFDFATTELARLAGYSSGQLANTKMLLEINLSKAFRFLDKKFMSFREWTNTRRLRIFKAWRVYNRSSLFLVETAVLVGYVQIFIRLMNKLLSVGDVYFQIRVLSNLRDSTSNLVRGVNDLAEFSIELKDTYTLFQTKPSFKDGKEKLPDLEKGPKIEFKDVTFRYPRAETDTIKNLNLKIRSGEKVAIVGHNGAGKTTLVKLIARIYQTTKGEIEINDINLDSIKIDTWYKNMGVLFQEYNTHPQLTVKENIYIGKSEEPVDEVAIRLAAISADAIDFIEELPDKFDQILDEKVKGGVRLSTGQWQKLAIARFFYRNSPLVIFDEPTASIDAVSEYNIFNKIYKFFKGKTVIIISHRFSTVRNADRIIVMEKGKIIEEGSHKKLMGQDGYYAKAFKLQAEGYSD